MSIFRRIFNFEQAKVEQLEKRLNQRYALGGGFPLRATLRHAGRDYSTKVIDMSSSGVGLEASPELAISAGLHLRLDLALEKHRLEIEARVAHQKERDQAPYLGLSLVFPEFDVQKSYLQLLQPVVIGQSLRPMPPEGVIQDDPRFIKQGYMGDLDSQLTVRVDPAQGMALHSFDFRMQNYFCRGGPQLNPPEAGALDASEARATNPVFETSGGLRDEVHQLFRWVVPNISTSVPQNIRVFLARFAG